jgi:4'-phosphopantetheinyl transferase
VQPKANELRVGYVLTQDLAPSTLPRLASQLSHTEQLRLSTFLRFEEKTAFALGRLLVCRMLSEFAPTPSTGWRIQVNGFGKPVLDRSDDLPDLRFNISHCAGLVAAIVTLGRDVGIDAEFISDRIDHLEIARLQLHPVERGLLHGLNGIPQRNAFFSLWTLRESYLKATGVGLAAGHSNVCFSLNPPTAFSSSSDTKTSSEWYFSHHQPTPLHIVSVAAHREPSEQLFCHHKLFQIDDLCL